MHYVLVLIVDSFFNIGEAWHQGGVGWEGLESFHAFITHLRHLNSPKLRHLNSPKARCHFLVPLHQVHLQDKAMGSMKSKQNKLISIWGKAICYLLYIPGVKGEDLEEYIITSLILFWCQSSDTCLGIKYC